MPGTRLTHAARRSSTTTRARRAPTSASGAVTRTTCTAAATALDGLMGIQQLLVLGESEPIRHPSDVVSDHTRFAVLNEPSSHVPGQLTRIVSIDSVEISKDPFRFAVHAQHPGVMIEVFEEEALQNPRSLCDLFRRSDNWRC